MTGLFDAPSDTSREALAAQRPDKIRRDYAAILEYMREQRDHGATRHELSKATGFRLSTICARVNELVKLGWLIETERKRKTDTGCKAFVLVAPIAS